MAKIIRRTFPNWAWMLLVFFVGLLAVAWFALSKPLPEYLVAKAELGAGGALELVALEKVALDLGPLSNKYITAEQFQSDLQLVDTIASGELIPLSKLARELAPGQTSIRITPTLQVAKNVVPGSWVSIWRVVEVKDSFKTELLIPRSKVISIIDEEGVFANSVPQVELLIDITSSSLVMESITAEHDLYILPLP